MAKHGKAHKKAQTGRQIPTGSLPRIQTPTKEMLMAGTSPAQTITPSAAPTAMSSSGSFSAMPYMQSAADIIQGIQMLKEQRNALQQARQQEQLTGVFAQAAMSRPVQQPRRQYVRPEDVIFQPQQMSPSYGVQGSNVLAQDGTVIRNNIGGTPTEIQNIYNPGTMYTDLGYEPLNDSNKVKAFEKGGKLKKAEFGNQNWMQGTEFGNIMGKQGGGEFASSLGEYATGGPSGGSKIGKGIGSAAGTAFFGPVGGAVGGAIGSFIGGALDQTQEKIEASDERKNRNVGNIMGQSAAIDFQEQFGLKEGGNVSPYEWMSHTWQPRVITTFGEHKLKDLLKPPADADMLRAGGHLKEYTPPSERAMSTERPAMQMGGELQTHWGGYAEPMSYNPYLPEGGETIMFRGQSHDESDGKGNTGIGITYGDNPVEVERGEPAVKLQDGTSGESNLTVFGNIKITNAFADMLADSKAKGKKFKTYVADLSKQENKQNKLIDKSVEQLDSLNVQSSFDKLTLGTLQANMKGANAKLKDLADKKINAAALQNAINDTKEEELVKVTDSGDVLAEKGAKIPKAQFGIPVQQSGLLPYQMVPSNETPAPGRPTARQRQVAASKDDYVSKYGLVPWKGNVTGLGMSTASELSTKEWDEVADTLGFKGKGNKEFQEFLLSNPQARPLIEARHKSLYGKSPFVDERLGAGWEGVGELIKPRTGGLPRTLRTLPPTVLPTPSATPTQARRATMPTAPTAPNLMPYLNQALQFLRPSDVESLDANQLVGEMFALSQNQVEPVWAQKFTPELSTPMDISLQDILNENQAAYNATQRLVGYNPSALASLNAQKYAANQRVLGEQFRLNQAEKQRVYEQNRNLLNQAELQNLQILERQADKQAMALSKTKATTQAALSSIASKYAQNKLENRTLAVYENMYNYRYDPSFRLQNMQLAQFNVPTVGMTTPTKAAKNGKSVKKTSLNSAVAKAFKNL
jgi:hypothetical protein